MTPTSATTAPIELSADIRAFLDEVKPAVVATVRRNGSVQMNPIWYDRDGNDIRINATVSRWWGKRLSPGSEVTLFFIDPANMWRWLEVRGRVASKGTEGGEEHIDTLSHRYLGSDYANHDPSDPRLLLTVEPIAVHGTFNGNAR